MTTKPLKEPEKLQYLQRIRYMPNRFTVNAKTTFRDEDEPTTREVMNGDEMQTWLLATQEERDALKQLVYREKGNKVIGRMCHLQSSCEKENEMSWEPWRNIKTDW